MSKTQEKTLTILVALVLAASTTQADVIEADDSRFGPRSLTIDTRTGLVWLDLPWTVDLSYWDVEALKGPGDRFEGFRHATAEEVRSLYTSAGVNLGYSGPSSASFQAAESLIAMIGQTGVQGVPESYGISGSIVNGLARVPYVRYGYPSPQGTLGYYAVADVEMEGSLSYGLFFHAPSVGNWLVQVPEPSTIGLLGVGLVVVAFSFVLSRARKTRQMLLSNEKG